MVSELNSPSHVQPLGCFFAGIDLTEPTVEAVNQNGQNSVRPERYTYPVLHLVAGSNPGAAAASCRT